MKLASDLLKQASHLARQEPRRPKQVSLRRAVSTAYYALFHLLVDAASRLFSRDDEIVAALNRIYSHEEMRKASANFSSRQLPRALVGLCTIPPELTRVADVFKALQEARHEVDYDVSKSLTRKEAFALIEQVQQAFADWDAIRNQDAARLYLASFLLWKRWDEKR